MIRRVCTILAVAIVAMAGCSRPTPQVREVVREVTRIVVQTAVILPTLTPEPTSTSSVTPVEIPSGWLTESLDGCPITFGHPSIWTLIERRNQATYFSVNPAIEVGVACYHDSSDTVLLQSEATAISVALPLVEGKIQDASVIEFRHVADTPFAITSATFAGTESTTKDAVELTLYEMTGLPQWRVIVFVMGAPNLNDQAQTLDMLAKSVRLGKEVVPTSVSPKPSPLARSSPKPTSAPTWREIVRWEGTGIKNTETFHIASSEWRIHWATKPGQYGAMNFQIYVYGSEDYPVSVAANIIGEGEDVSYMRGSGDFYLTINTAQPYVVVVEAK